MPLESPWIRLTNVFYVAGLTINVLNTKMAFCFEETSLLFLLKKNLFNRPPPPHVKTNSETTYGPTLTLPIPKNK